MVKLIANRSMRYAGRRVASGDVFEATSRDARVLVAVNRADVYVEPVRRVSFATAEVALAEIDSTEQPDAAEKSAEPKRTYKRRDMKAEG